MVSGTLPPYSSTSILLAATISRALARQKPVEWMISPTSSSVAAARASRVGYFAYRMGVTRFTRASVHWAARRTENSSS